MLRRAPVHPILVAIFPLLALLAENAQEIRLLSSARSFLVVLFSVVLVYLFLAWMLRDVARSALLLSVGLLVFFSYGHVYDALKASQIFGLLIGRHRYLIPASLLLIGIWSYVVIGRLREPAPINRVFTIVGLVLLVGPSLLLLRKTVLQNTDWTSRPAVGEEVVGSNEVQGKLPDIYYFIFDSYARSDAMLQTFEFDNKPFLEHLRSQSFYIAGQSHANHNWTALSLASSLNMTYVQDLGLDLTPGSYPGILVEPIQQSNVRRTLEAMGYRTVGFKSGYLPTELEDADIYLEPALETESGENGLEIRLNRFEHNLLRSSAGLILSDLFGDQLYDWVGFRTDYPFEDLRRIIRFQFDAVPQAVEAEGPKFVFMHVLAPHRPYLFGPNGEPLQPKGSFTLQEDSEEADDLGQIGLYRDQAIFITKEIQFAVDTILADSEVPPIIILQADTGPSIAEGWNSPEGAELWQRTAILSAYHLPGECGDHLYPSITPVNSFRLILSCYFALDYPLLEDRVYFSYWPRRASYEFIPVTEYVRERVDNLP